MVRSVRVSLISEGVLPTTVGGVGRWLNYLITQLINVEFNLTVLGGLPKFKHDRIADYTSVPLVHRARWGPKDPEPLKKLFKLFLQNAENQLITSTGLALSTLLLTIAFLYILEADYHALNP